MFGSSYDFHVEIPFVGDMESDSLNSWLIPPNQSKTIAKVNVMATRAMNLSAFIRYMKFKAMNEEMTL